MNKRLVWNFEINSHPLMQLPTKSIHKEEAKWETRYFWPADAIIELKGLNDYFLDLSLYALKKRKDCYYVLTDKNLNIKIRNEKLLYKPIIKQEKNTLAFGKKINLSEKKPVEVLPGLNGHTTKELLDILKDRGQKIEVSKEILIHQFPTSPKTRLELGRLQIESKTYFTVSIESRALPFVQSFSRHLLGHQLSTDYITFLKNLSHDD